MKQSKLKISRAKRHPNKNFTGIWINKFGRKHWLKNGKYHREDGPAIEWPNGEKFWYKNGIYFNMKIIELF